MTMKSAIGQRAVGRAGVRCMGSAKVERLLGAGVEIAVCNRTHTKAQPRSVEWVGGYGGLELARGLSGSWRHLHRNWK